MARCPAGQSALISIAMLCFRRQLSNDVLMSAMARNAIANHFRQNKFVKHL
jgi:hypothetical protein